MIDIAAPHIQDGRGGVRLVSEFKLDGKSNELWFEIDREYGALVEDNSADAFLLSLLLVAMAEGHEVRVTGAVSERLTYNLRRAQHVLIAAIPRLYLVDIVPESLVVASTRAKGVATGFSGGVDSFSAIADHVRPDTPESLRLTHLTLHNIGSHGREGVVKHLRLKEHLANAAAEIGLPLVSIDSNLDSVYRAHGIGFMESHTVRNVAAVMCMQAGIGRYLYASSYSYRDTSVVNTFGGIATCDPIILPLLSTEIFESISVGCEYNRIGKILQINNINITHQYASVCINSSSKAENCSKCSKCLRTMLVLEIAGILYNYYKVFDLHEYRRHRARFMAKVLYDPHPLMREIREYARANKFAFPAEARLRSISGVSFVQEKIASAVKTLKYKMLKSI